MWWLTTPVTTVLGSHTLFLGLVHQAHMHTDMYVGKTAMHIKINTNFKRRVVADKLLDKFLKV